MTTATPSTPTIEKSAQTRNLLLALLAFAITFWAWNLIGPLGVRYSTELGLSATQKSLLVAMPVLVGSLGRIPVGALTDRYGGRVMFTIMLFASIVPVLLVCLAGTLKSYSLLLVFGFLLGIAGTTFAIGIPFVNAWYEKPAAASPPASSAAWAAPRSRRSSPRGWCSRSATSPPTCPSRSPLPSSG